ncbi:MAG TPA: choice-of-anchor L domain-containing protein, partial [Flavobacteriales bacterium]
MNAVTLRTIATHHHRLRLLAGSVLLSGLVQAQLTVNTQTNLQHLAQSITGTGVQIINPQITCHAQGYGEFTYAGSLLGIDEGVLLTTGRLTEAVGPNNVENKSFQANTPGNTLLNVVTNRTTYDACKLEFDIIPAGDSLQFDFALGSEEYNEWVGSEYNDVFGFFISGPGITGDPGVGANHNIARVPVTGQPVTINNVNAGSNQAYYYNNAGGQHIQYDGFTRNLTAVAVVQPCATYHLQLIVADASDRKFDSGVFIAEVKSNPVTMSAITASGAPYLVEGCNNGHVRFSRQIATPLPLTLQYYLSGTATNGTDYAAIGNTDPSVPKTVVIPANQTYVDQPFATVADNLNEGSELIRIILGNPNCPSAAALDTLEVLLLDTLIGAVQPVGPIICQGDSVQFQATPGLSYSWTPATDLSSTTSADPWASPTTTTQYRIEMTQGSCSRTVYRNVRVSRLALSAVVTRPLCNGGNNGAINLSIADGIAPYTYSWTGPNGFTANTQDLTGLVAGTYTVTVQDAACSRTQSYNVGQPTVLAVSLSPSLLVFGQNISCSGGSDGSINSAITGGTAPYTVQWSGPNGYAATTPNISGLGEGNYTVQVTDANGCTTGASASMAAAGPLQATPGPVTHSICYNDHLGSVNVIASGGAPPYTYTWNTTPVQTTATASGLSPGTYQVLVRDVYGCTTSMTAVVNGPVQAFTVSLASRTNVLCHGNATGSASVSAAGGTPPYTFQWNTSPATNGNSISNRPAGTYTVTVTDANSCTVSLPVTITEPAQPLSGTIAAQQNIACRGTSTGGATVQGQGGVGPYTYVWNTTPAVNGATISGRPAGTYTATITDVNGCQTTVPVTLTQPAAVLSATVPSRTDALCFGSANGTATAVGGGGTAPYTYSWNTTPVQTTATATGLAAGTYTVTVTDAALCVTTTNAVVGQPAVITISGTITPALCQGAASGAVDVTVTGGAGAYQYAWSSGPGFSATTQDISGLSAGGYTLVVTDANGCTATRTFEVGQPGLFTVGAVLSDHNGVNVSCPSSSDGSIDLSVSGAQPPYTYIWTGPNGFSAATQDISGVPSGTYAVTITDANGCGTGASYTLTAPSPLSIQLVAGDHNGHAVGCHGGSDGSINATIGGGIAPYAKSWSGPNGFSSNVEDPSGLPAGTYTLQVTDANGCIATQTITLNAAPAIVVSAGPVTGQSCFGSANGQATMTVSGGTGPFTWNWSTLPAQHAATATGLIAGSYTVGVVDANGCTGSATVNVPGPSAALTVSTTNITHVLCHQGTTGTATVQASGGTSAYTYVWNTTPQQTGPTATGLAAGSYTVQVTDANGCTASRVISIGQPAAPLSAALLSRTNVTCFGANNGTASISVSGGSGAWSVQWNTTPVQTGATATNLPVGTWTATITDNNGCATPLQFPVTITGPSAALALDLVPYTYTGGANVSCVGNTDGSIHSNVSGGTPPYTYQWTHPNGTTSAGAHPSGLGIGTHTLRVLDANGCQIQSSATLIAPTAVTTSAVIVSAICHGDNSGSIQLTVNGGASPYGFAWTGPNGFTASTRNISALYAGVYFIHVTDANGCVSLSAYDVTEPGTFTFSPILSQHDADNISCANGSDGSIDMTVSGGTMPYSYSWSSIDGAEGSTQDLNGIDAGTYFLVLTDHFGCQGLSTQVLTEPDPLTLMLSAQTYAGGYNVTCNGAPNGSITAVIGGGSPGYAAAWTGPSGYTSTQPNISGLAPGTYHLTVTDNNGCTITSSITLIGPSALQATLTTGSFAGGTGISCAGADDGSAQLQVSGGTVPLGVSWSGPSGFTSSAWSISGLAPGTYTATITDGNGCSIVRQATITAPAVLAASGVVPQFNGFGIPCNGGSNGSIDLSVIGGSGTYTYAWTGPSAFVSNVQDVVGAVAGNYSVHVMDANGCSTDVAFDITQPTAVGTSGAVSTAACQGSATGAVDLTTTGGVAPYAWAWSGPAAFSASTQDISNLFAGVYQVSVQDANGCEHANTFNVGQPGMFNITAQLSQYAGGFQVSCAGANDGWIDATLTGGTPGYNYFWTGPNAFSATTQDISDLAPGTYVLSMTDANGCGSSAQYQLSAPSPLAMGLTPSLYAGGSNTGCSGSADGSIDAVISGGVAPYTFAWTG